MKFPYINKDWNLDETEDLVSAPDFLENIDWVYFEKKVELIKETKKEKVVEVKEETEEDDVEIKALAYLKEQKVRWAHLLKWQNLIDRALAEWFIL